MGMLSENDGFRLNLETRIIRRERFFFFQWSCKYVNMRLCLENIVFHYIQIRRRTL